MSEEAFVRACTGCMQRSLAFSRMRVCPENHIYWHTREACSEISKTVGVKWTTVLRYYDHFYGRIDFKEYRELWPQVAHPDLLLKEVMDL